MKRVLVLATLLATGMSAFAQTGSRILRFEPNGPGNVGLKGNDRETSKIYHYYKSKADERVAAGIWSSPDFSGRMRKVTNTEFIYILEGAVTLADKSGREETFKVGDAVLIPRGTEFQRRVWSTLLTIPYGETRTYGQIAEQIGNPTAVRAVGAANGRNPISIIAPCHRVIGMNGNLTGFGGGLDAKAMEFESKTLKVEKVVAGSSDATINVRAQKPGRYEFFDEYNEKVARGALVVK